jgi:hypothetical protein
MGCKDCGQGVEKGIGEGVEEGVGQRFWGDCLVFGLPGVQGVGGCRLEGQDGLQGTAQLSSLVLELSVSVVTCQYF